MAFHVEISAGMGHARVFNLDRADLTEKLLQPWLEGRTIAMGDQEWVPRDSKLTILEGPHMDPPDLQFGQGWSNALRKSEKVTRRMLEQAPPPELPDAFVVEAESPEGLVAQLAPSGAEAIPWNEAKDRIDGRDPSIAAVVLVVRPPEKRDSPNR